MITRFSILISLFCLLGCEQTFTLEDFIPPPQETVVSEIPSEFAYVSTHFPQECDWKSLKRVVDGDTIIVEQDTRVRLIGIDTPETKREDYPVEPYGPEASEFTANFLADATQVCLIEDHIGDKYDQYGRKLSYVFTEDGKDLNGAILKAGLARGYFRFPFDRKTEFRSYERQARAKKVNLWE